MGLLVKGDKIVDGLHEDSFPIQITVYVNYM
jgi:hypothetical protein